ncbi:MAG: hypothetical protein SFU25_12260 [Candidatus Caenarcaniphilales bacterium]|nr:hypothetical protein [Candidatus Caenarcaniphilales bacterium]
MSSDLDINKFDPKDPDPWLALYLDSNSFMEDSAKQALLKSNSSWCRRFIFPLVFPIARLFIGIVKLIRIIFPKHPQSSQLLHLTIYWGLKYFVSPEANYMILRHFNIGSENLKFIADNIPGIEIKTVKPLKTLCLEDLIDDTFLIHDLNIFNFVIELNQQLKEKKLEIKTPERINFDSISIEPFEISALPKKWHNFVDLHTAIEVYTPLYALFLSDADFWRASNSLQLDQTIALYISKILEKPEAAMLVNNKHPMIPLFILAAGYRLMLHGHDAEALHGMLRKMKTKQKELDETQAI